MSVLRPRKRLIYVRISEDEFQRFTRLCQTEGVRSMSDLMRAALDRLMAERTNDPDHQNAAMLRVIGDTVSEVNQKVGHLASILDQIYRHDGLPSAHPVTDQAPVDPNMNGDADATETRPRTAHLDGNGSASLG